MSSWVDEMGRPFQADGSSVRGSEAEEAGPIMKSFLGHFDKVCTLSNKQQIDINGF